jgi:hypothetical protein
MAGTNRSSGGDSAEGRLERMSRVNLSLERRIATNQSVDAVTIVRPDRFALFGRYEVTLMGLDGEVWGCQAASAPCWLTPDGAHLLVPDCFELKLADASTLELVRIVAVPEDTQEGANEFQGVLAISADQLVTWSRLRGLELRSGSGVTTRSEFLPDPGASDTRLSCDAQATKVVAIKRGGRRAVVWDVRTGAMRVFDPGSELRDASVSADGRRLAVATDQLLVVYDIDSGAVVTERERYEIKALVWLGRFVLLTGYGAELHDPTIVEPLWTRPDIDATALTAASNGVIAVSEGELSMWKLEDGSS